MSVVYLVHNGVVYSLDTPQRGVLCGVLPGYTTAWCTWYTMAWCTPWIHNGVVYLVHNGMVYFLDTQRRGVLRGVPGTQRRGVLPGYTTTWCTPLCTVHHGTPRKCTMSLCTYTTKSHSKSCDHSSQPIRRLHSLKSPKLSEKL